MHSDRSEYLHELLEGQELTGIEIGALDRPLLTRDNLSSGSEILYADHLSTDELRKKYQSDSSVDLSKLVDVDLIDASGDFADSLNGRLVDYIVASHVVEHVPNPIRWFQMLFKMLRPGGFVFLVVPDKRFTFDYQRPLTTCGEMLQSFFSNKEMPSVADVFDHYSSAVMIDGGKVWSGLLGGGELTPLASNVDALKYAKEVHNKGRYHDVHVSVFTPASFFSIIERLIRINLFSPEITHFKDTGINDIEFFVCMKKPELAVEATQTRCLSSIPDLSLESFVSPYMPQVKSLSRSLEIITEVQQNFQKSFNRLEIEIVDQREQTKLLAEQLRMAQGVLDRKSVRFILKLTHTIFQSFKLRARKNNQGREKNDL